jgi:hypothetical protein
VKGTIGLSSANELLRFAPESPIVRLLAALSKGARRALGKTCRSLSASVQKMLRTLIILLNRRREKIFSGLVAAHAIEIVARALDERARQQTSDKTRKICASRAAHTLRVSRSSAHYSRFTA